MKSVLEKPSRRRRDEFLEAVGRSRRLHGRWVSPPDSAESFDRYLRRLRSPAQAGYFVSSDEGELAGVVNVSEIVRGAFCSAYLGYYAFVPHHDRGFMKRGLAAVIDEAFGPEGLHRLEANVQPENVASMALVKRLGFRREGYSPRYLKIRGRWRDHVRWAIIAEDWRKRPRGGSTR